MSVSKHFFSKTADRIFLKFHMKLEWPKTKELTESDFSEKTLILGDNIIKNTPRIWFFGFCKIIDV